MNRRRRRHESTAYHEAGHAVAAFVLRLKIGRRGVTIVPDKEHDVLGYANIAAQLRERVKKCALCCRNPHLPPSGLTRGLS
jgi:ATP-dependent Zn protease